MFFKTKYVERKVKKEHLSKKEKLVLLQNLQNLYQFKTLKLLVSPKI